MIQYIGLLRSLNVGPNNRIKMPELESLLKELGFSGLKSYLQSGNLVFGSDVTDPQIVASHIEEAITKGSGLEIRVVVKTQTEMLRIAGNNPFLKIDGIEAEFLHVTFLFEQPEERKTKLIEMIHDPRDSFKLAGREIYLYCPGGYGNTKFSNTFFEKKLGVAATTRNWRTVNVLASMAVQG
jgi:uncharacterized protein (DUF1697 family)